MTSPSSGDMGHGFAGRAAVVLSAVFLLLTIAARSQDQVPKTDFATFLAQVERGEVTSVELHQRNNRAKMGT